VGQGLTLSILSFGKVFSLGWSGDRDRREKGEGPFGEEKKEGEKEEGCLARFQNWGFS